MEQKKELNLDEMDKVSGGAHDYEENRRYDGSGYYCRHCGQIFATNRLLKDHIKTDHPDRV